jgi:large subunit ribosomal protein L16
MLEPKRVKHKKHFRGKMPGEARSGNKVSVGEFGLQATQRGWINSRQLESARKAIVKEMKRKGKLWIRAFPDLPYTGKPAEVRMGKGKGEVQGYVAVIRPGKVLFEISGVTEEIAREAFRKGGNKLPLLSKVVTKDVL